jgi:hypothetical protein
MRRRICSALTMAAMICGMCLGSGLAQTRAAVSSQVAVLPAGAERVGDCEQAVRDGRTLKAEMLKLLAEAREGKVSPSTVPRPQPPKSNALTKGQKVSIGVGVAAAVVVLAIILSRGGGSDRFVAPPCPTGQLCQ